MLLRRIGSVPDATVPPIPRTIVGDIMPDVVEPLQFLAVPVLTLALAGRRASEVSPCLFHSDDVGKSWVRLNDDQHQWASAP